MYYIVNYDRWESYKKSFSTFKDAFMMQQLKFPDSIIEFFDGNERKVVWEPWYEEVSLNES